MDYLIFFFILIIFLILIIYGLPFKNTNFNNQIADLQKEIVRENFKSSSENDIKQGASTFYDWGLRRDDDVPEECDIEPPPKLKSCSGVKCLDGKKTYVQNDYYIYPEEKKPEQPNCGNCEAYQCKNIDRYVLKSSVPPCPDMSEYALKSMVKPCPDLNNYVLKSEIPPCPEQPDLTKYVLKSQIPACPTPVVCPECPVCPPAYKYIQDDPRFKNWLIHFEDDVEEKINKLYIRKMDCNKKIEESYKKGVEEGKNDAYKNIVERVGPDVLRKCLQSGKSSSNNNNKSSEKESIGYLNDIIRYIDRNPKKEPQREPQREFQREPQREFQREPQREFQRGPQREPQREFQRGPQREPQREFQREPQREPQREFQREPQREPQRDPLREPQREPQRDPLREPQRDPLREPQREPQQDRPNNFYNERNRLEDLDKRIEFNKNIKREENLSNSNNQIINTNSADDEFVLGWDPTSLGFGSINYQMKKPNIK
jgi:hypothetical protein